MEYFALDAKNPSNASISLLSCNIFVERWNRIKTSSLGQLSFVRSAQLLTSSEEKKNVSHGDLFMVDYLLKLLEICIFLYDNFEGDMNSAICNLNSWQDLSIFVFNAPSKLRLSAYDEIRWIRSICLVFGSSSPIPEYLNALSPLCCRECHYVFLSGGLLLPESTLTDNSFVLSGFLVLPAQLKSSFCLRIAEAFKKTKFQLADRDSHRQFCSFRIPPGTIFEQKIEQILAPVFDVILDNLDNIISCLARKILKSPRGSFGISLMSTLALDDTVLLYKVRQNDFACAECISQMTVCNYLIHVLNKWFADVMREVFISLAELSPVQPCCGRRCAYLVNSVLASRVGYHVTPAIKWSAEARILMVHRTHLLAQKISQGAVQNGTHMAAEHSWRSHLLTSILAQFATDESFENGKIRVLDSSDPSLSSYLFLNSSEMNAYMRDNKELNETPKLESYPFELPFLSLPLKNLQNNINSNHAAGLNYLPHPSNTNLFCHKPCNDKFIAKVTNSSVEVPHISLLDPIHSTLFVLSALLLNEQQTQPDLNHGDNQFTSQNNQKLRTSVETVLKSSLYAFESFAAVPPLYVPANPRVRNLHNNMNGTTAGAGNKDFFLNSNVKNKVFALSTIFLESVSSDISNSNGFENVRTEKNGGLKLGPILDLITLTSKTLRSLANNRKSPEPDAEDNLIIEDNLSAQARSSSSSFPQTKHLNNESNSAIKVHHEYIPMKIKNCLTRPIVCPVDIRLLQSPSLNDNDQVVDNLEGKVDQPAEIRLPPRLLAWLTGKLAVMKNIVQLNHKNKQNQNISNNSQGIINKDNNNNIAGSTTSNQKKKVSALPSPYAVNSRSSLSATSTPPVHLNNTTDKYQRKNDSHLKTPDRFATPNNSHFTPELHALFALINHRGSPYSPQHVAAVAAAANSIASSKQHHHMHYQMNPYMSPLPSPLHDSQYMSPPGSHPARYPPYPPPPPPPPRQQDLQHHHTREDDPNTASQNNNRNNQNKKQDSQNQQQNGVLLPPFPSSLVSNNHNNNKDNSSSVHQTAPPLSAPTLVAASAVSPFGSLGSPPFSAPPAFLPGGSHSRMMQSSASIFPPPLPTIDIATLESIKNGKVDGQTAVSVSGTAQTTVAPPTLLTLNSNATPPTFVSPAFPHQNLETSSTSGHFLNTSPGHPHPAAYGLYNPYYVQMVMQHMQQQHGGFNSHAQNGSLHHHAASFLHTHMTPNSHPHIINHNNNFIMLNGNNQLQQLNHSGNMNKNNSGGIFLDAPTIEGTTGLFAGRPSTAPSPPRGDGNADELPKDGDIITKQ